MAKSDEKNVDFLLEGAEPEESLHIDSIECRSCEALYSILLEHDYLYEESRWCPFCGEYTSGEDE